MKHLLRLLIVGLLALIASFALAQSVLIKPLDKLRVTCEEEPSLNRDYIVTNDGFLLMNFIGAVRVVGLTEPQAAKAISDELVRQRIVKTASVTVRLVGGGTNAVKFTGAVKNFGEVPWKEGLRLKDIVAVAQPTNLADLTKVAIETVDGRTLFIDFTKYEGKDPSAYNPTLKPGDTVKFNRAQESRNVFVLGAVAKPGPVEFKSGLTLAEAVEMAGGFTSSADTARIRIQSGTAKERVVTLQEGGSKALQSGDRVFIEFLPKDNTIYVTGGVVTPGLLAYEPGMTLGLAIKRAGGYLPNLEPKTIKVIRRENGRNKTIKVDLKRIREGFVGDFILQKDDRIEVPLPGRGGGRSNLLTLAGIIIGIFLFGG